MTDNTSHPARGSNTTHPEPLIISPSQTHNQTIIILHGRGSTALKFGPPLLASSMLESQTLRTAFPHAKFIFPMAPLRRAVIYKRRLTHQWFDNWHLSEPGLREELQLDGLRESSASIHAMLRAEMALVGERNVVLWGLSQGCAATLVALLTWDGEPFGAAVGMCGWLPLVSHLRDTVDGEGVGEAVGGDEEDVFEHGASVDSGVDPAASAVAYLLEELGMENRSTALAFRRVPIFLGHGVEDNKVSVNLGREAAGCLKALGADVRWKEYEELGHWYSEEMLNDIKDFFDERLYESKQAPMLGIKSD